MDNLFEEKTITRHYTNADVTFDHFICYPTSQLINDDHDEILADDLYKDPYYANFLENPLTPEQIKEDLRVFNQGTVEKGATLEIKLMKDRNDNLFGYIVHINDILVDLKKIPNGPIIGPQTINNIPISEFAY